MCGGALPEQLSYQHGSSLMMRVKCVQVSVQQFGSGFGF